MLQLSNLSGRLSRRRLLRAGLIVIVPLAIEKVFELFLSAEGLARGRWIQAGLVRAVEEFNFVAFIGRFMESFALLPGAAGDFLHGLLGRGIVTQLLLYLTVPIAWLVAFFWTPVDMLLNERPLTILIAVLQIAAFWIAYERSRGKEGKPLVAMVTEEQGFDRFVMALAFYFTLMVGGLLVGVWLYMILGAGTFLFGWALDLAALFLFANSFLAFLYLFVMNYAQDRTKRYAEAAIDRHLGDGNPQA
jgi:hypothetical protein